MSPLELELKLSLPPEVPVAELLAEVAGVLGPLPPAGMRELADLYLDTRGGELRRRGWGLRLRESRKSSKLTLKSLKSEEKELAARQEIQVSGAPGVSLEDLLADALFAELRSWLGDRPLEPLFTLEKKQRTWHMPLDGLELELTLDEVRVREHPEVPCFGELEMELLRGDAGRFRALARRLQSALGYPGSTESKLARVQRLLGGSVSPLTDS